ncbi:hypothetical protein GOV12_00635 [Candidatus Pacearchaeota archaeon]|nr:hypothetical protein [Candidatus Pacearchaeota archaeon]
MIDVDGNCIIEYEDYNIINWWFDMTTHIRGDNSITLSDDFEFWSVFENAPNVDYNPNITGPACDGTVTGTPYSIDGGYVGALDCPGAIPTLSPSQGLSDVFSGLVDWLRDLFTFEDYVVLETNPVQQSTITGEVVSWEEGMELNGSVANIELVGVNPEVKLLGEYLVNELLGLNVSVKSLTIGYIIKDNDTRNDEDVGNIIINFE